MVLCQAWNILLTARDIALDPGHRDDPSWRGEHCSLQLHVQRVVPSSCTMSKDETKILLDNWAVEIFPRSGVGGGCYCRSPFFCVYAGQAGLSPEGQHSFMTVKGLWGGVESPSSCCLPHFYHIKTEHVSCGAHCSFSSHF